MKTIAKCAVDLVESIALSSFFTSEFWQELLITLLVVILNAIMIPLIKKLLSYIRTKAKLDEYMNDEDFKKYLSMIDIVAKKLSQDELEKYHEDYIKKKENS